MNAHPRDEIADTTFLDTALAGDVVVDLGQLGAVDHRVLYQAVRAGQLVKWRGKWFPNAGAPWGIGPDKSCWSTPEVAAFWAEAKRGTVHLTGAAA